MRLSNKSNVTLLSFVIVLALSMQSVAAGTEVSAEDIFAMSLEELLDVEVVTASRQKEPLSEAVSTTYVITGEQIQAMGARTIYDALALVPGITVSGNKVGGNKLFFRGVGSEFSSQILLLLDNHVLNEPLSGGAIASFLDRLAVENIQRIEVVQGPGSSLYGGNAFLGMINVITRKGAEIGGVEATVRAEFDESGFAVNRYNLLYGDHFENGWDVSVNFHGIHGDGVERVVEYDLLGRSGVADSREEDYAFDLQVENTAFALHARYYNRDAGGYYGVYNILNDDTRIDTDHGFIDAAYQLITKDDLTLELRGAADQSSSDLYYVLFPEDTPMGPYTLAADYELLTYSTELRGGYSGFSGHRLTSGLVYRHEAMENPHYWVNEIPNPANWIDEARRDIWAVYVNDNYQITRELLATISGRYDHYSDFGGSFSPRLGMSWQVNEVVKLKGLYGTAFRPPDFASQYAKNNPIVASNPELNQEKITTWELGVSVTPNEQVLVQATLFRNEIKDLIGPGSGLPKIWDNVDQVISQGVELNLSYDISRSLQLSGTYTFVDIDYDPGYPQPSVPENSGSIDLDYRINSILHFNLNGFGQDASKRAEDDTRDDLPGFVVFNTTLTADITRELELQFSIFNLFDQQYAYAAPANTIPEDYTAPSRSFMLGLRYGF